MRILQLIGGLDASGAETVVVNLSNGLIDAGHSVVVCARMTGVLADRLRAPLEVLRKRGTLDWQYVRALCSLIRRHDVDVVHSHLFGNDLYAWPAATLTRRGLVITIHGADAIRTAKRRFAYRVIGRGADRVVVVSEALRDEFSRARYGLGEGLDLIPNGIDWNDRDGSPPPDIRAELGLGPHQPIVGAVGNIKRVKGYEILIDAFAAIRSRHHDAVLVIAGADEDQAYGRELVALAAKVGVEGAVHFLGSRRDVRRLLDTFQVYVVASHYEGTSLALLEAMGAGLPVVATDVGGNPALVRKGQTGMLVPPADSEAMASAVCRLLSDAGARARLGRAARERVRPAFDLSVMVDRYSMLYQGVIDARRQNGRNARPVPRAPL